MHSFKPEILALHQSGIRRATERCNELGGINLGQGICDIPMHSEIIEAAYQAMTQGHNLYGAKEGLHSLRKAVQQKILNHNRMAVDVEQVMISHGSTGSFVCAAEVLFAKGDEVILFEPFYGYHKKLLELKGIVCKVVPMDLLNLTFAEAALKKAITARTKGIVVCTPCNPTGKVFSREELLLIGTLAKEHKLWVVTDEIYEHITFSGYEHVSLASLDDFQKRTITISGFSKTYNMTGWRLGYAAGPKDVIEKMALVQDLMYVCPATPLQYASLSALQLPQSYYEQMRQTYLHKRDHLRQALQDMGFTVPQTQGSYYLMADFSQLGFANDTLAMDFFLEKARVATVTGSSFFVDRERGKTWLRFCFGRSQETLDEAMQHMRQALQNR